MKTKNLAISAIVLALLVGIIVVANVLSNRGPSAAAQQVFPELSEKDISAFNIVTDDEGVRVYKEGDRWMAVKLTSEQEQTAGAASDTSRESAAPVGGTGAAATGEFEPTGKPYPADSAAVATAVEKIATMERDVLISQNPEKQNVFEVGKEKGTLVQVFGDQGTKAGSFRVGKNATDFSSHYVREVGSNKVYSVPGNVKYSLFTDFDRWRDKTIMSFDKSLAKSIRIEKQGTSFTLTKTADTTGVDQWKLTAPENAPAKSEEVTKILDELASFKIADWEEDPLAAAEDLGLKDPEIAVTVTMENGDTQQLLIGDKKEGTSQFWVKLPEREDVYLVSDYTIQTFDKTPEDLKAPAETPVS